MSQTNPTPVDALPTAPSTSAPSTFASLADAFIAALATFRTQINAIATNAYGNAVDCFNNAGAAAASLASATTQAGNAAASANAAANSATAAAVTAGAAAWVSGQTYALNSVSISQVDFHTYRKKTASSSGTTDPSADATNWVLISGDTTASEGSLIHVSPDKPSPVSADEFAIADSANGYTLAKVSLTNLRAALGGAPSGAAVTNPMSGPLTLTSASKQLQVVYPDAEGRAVVLADATTYAAMGIVHIVRNDGSYPVQIQDNAAALLGYVAPGQTVLVALEAQGSAAGTWELCKLPYTAEQWNAGSPQVLTGSGVSYTSIVAINSNTVVLSYLDASNYPTVMAGTLVGNSVLWGSPLTLVSSAMAYCKSIALSSSKAMVTFSDTGSYNIYAAVVSVSGTVCTSGTIANLMNNGSGSSQGFASARISDTQAIVIGLSTSGYPNACTLSISGTTITTNALAQIDANRAGSGCQIAMLNATTAIAFYQRYSTGYPYSVLITVSGTTCIPGTPNNYYGGIMSVSSGDSGGIAVLSPTLIVSLQTPGGGSPTSAYPFTISGSTVTFTGHSLQVYSSAASSCLAVSSPTTAALTWNGTSGYNYLATMTLTGPSATPTLGPVTTIDAVSSGSPSVCLPNGTQAVVGYTGTTSYARSAVLNKSLLV